MVTHPPTGKRILERYVRKNVGLPTRAGQGGRLPIWYEGWKRKRGGASLSDIADWIEEEHEASYDERSVRHFIDQVEGLMSPVKI